MSRRLAFGRALLAAALPTLALAQPNMPELVPTSNPRPRALRFAESLSRLTYRQETETKEFSRPAGAVKKGRVTESTLRQEFQVSLWQVPDHPEVIRTETLPLRIGARSGRGVAGIELPKMPVTVNFIDRRGQPVDKAGVVQTGLRPTALVFPKQPVAPGDTWKRSVSETRELGMPTDVHFKYLREGRMAGRLVAELEMTAKGKGELDEGGLAALSIQTRFLFDIRLGRILHAKTRLFHSLIGRSPGKKFPAKRKVNKLVDMWARM